MELFRRVSASYAAWSRSLGLGSLALASRLSYFNENLSRSLRSDGGRDLLFKRDGLRVIMESMESFPRASWVMAQESFTISIE